MHKKYNLRKDVKKPKKLLSEYESSNIYRVIKKIKEEENILEETAENIDPDETVSEEDSEHNSDIEFIEIDKPDIVDEDYQKTVVRNMARKMFTEGPKRRRIEY